MAANQNPIFSRVGDVQWNTTDILASNATTDLTTGTSYLVFTADATNGGYVQKLRFRALGSNVATVARVWINNGAVTTTASNNVLWDEISLAISVASTTTALAVYELPLNIALPPAYRLYITLGTTVVAGYDCITIAGKY
jgi:hypothetical protein